MVVMEMTVQLSIYLTAEPNNHVEEMQRDSLRTFTLENEVTIFFLVKELFEAINKIST